MLIFMEGGKPENPEKNPRGTGEKNTSNKLNSHMILPKPGLEPGIIEVRGQRTNHYVTHATQLCIQENGIIFPVEYISGS